jgi:hypothetical protein
MTFIIFNDFGAVVAVSLAVVAVSLAVVAVSLAVVGVLTNHY